MDYQILMKLETWNDGFKRGHSTKIALLNVADSFCCAADRGQATTTTILILLNLPTNI